MEIYLFNHGSRHAGGYYHDIVVREPQVNRVYKNYKRSDYYRLVFVFFFAVATFVVSYIYSGKVTDLLAKAANVRIPLLYLV
jgi:PAT family beta-lactamase induction signal transducer AmpG